VVAKVAMNKQRSHRFHMEMFSNLNEIGVKETYCGEVRNRFADLEDMDTGVEINSALETVRETIKTSTKEHLSCYEFKNHKPWFDEGRLKLLE
jgi:lipoate-protein ligase A